MSNMGELFRQVAENNPKSPLSDVIKEVSGPPYKESRADRRKRELEKLGGRFEYIGKVWLDHRMGNPIPIFITEFRREWHEELLPQLSNSEESDRTQLISRIADGLMLSEKSNSSYRRLATRRTFSNAVASEAFAEIFGTDTFFSPASQVFIEVIGDLSGYSKEQKISFRSFMNKREDLRGFVTLPQTFPAVAEWLVQSRSNSQSSRLS